ncbi:MAG: hypothetical protein RLZZ292_2164 [Bacteroidota bacterium]|jgi:hypothetical protein
MFHQSIIVREDAAAHVAQHQQPSLENHFFEGFHILKTLFKDEYIHTFLAECLENNLKTILKGNAFYPHRICYSIYKQKE